MEYAAPVMEAGAQGHGPGGGEASAKGSSSRGCEATSSTSHHCPSSTNICCTGHGVCCTGYGDICTSICCTGSRAICTNICSTNHLWHFNVGRSDNWRLWSTNHWNQLRNRPLS